MRWWLQLEGETPKISIEPDNVGSRDEFLCGRCGALLAVDHQLWVRTVPGQTRLVCSVCQTSNLLRYASRTQA